MGKDEKDPGEPVWGGVSQELRKGQVKVRLGSTCRDGPGRGNKRDLEEVVLLLCLKFPFFRLKGEAKNRSQERRVSPNKEKVVSPTHEGKNNCGLGSRGGTAYLRWFTGVEKG